MLVIFVISACPHLDHGEEREVGRVGLVAREVPDELVPRPGDDLVLGARVLSPVFLQVAREQEARCISPRKSWSLDPGPRSLICFGVPPTPKAPTP